jgi:hypothetical protein
VALMSLEYSPAAKPETYFIVSLMDLLLLLLRVARIMTCENDFFFFCFICREMLQRNTSHLAERASIKIFQLINTVIG